MTSRSRWVPASRGQRQRGLFDLLGLLQGVRQHVVDALGGQRDAHPLGGELLHHRPRKLRQAGVVAGGQAHQRHLVVAGGADQLFRHLHQVVHAALPHRAVDHPRLAEATAPGAAAEDLQHDAVVDDLAVGHDDAVGIGDLVQIRQHGLHDHLGRAAAGLGRHGLHGAVGVVGHVVKRGHIDAGDVRAHAQVVLPGQARRLPLLVHVDGLEGLHLAVADGEHIDKGHQRLRVERAGTAADDEGSVMPVLAPKRYARQVQRLQDVREAHLVLEGDAQQVVIPDRRAGFQREQRYVVLPHQVCHVHPRGEHPLAPGVVPGVDGVVEYLHPQVGHAHLVGIGKQKSVAHRDVLRALHHGVVLAAHVAHRLLHRHEQRLNAVGKGHVIPPMYGDRHYIYYTLSRNPRFFNFGMLNNSSFPDTQRKSA